MPQFTPGEAKAAIVATSVWPSGLSCQAEVFLGPSEVTKVATSGLVPFTSTGASQDVHLPVTMPLAEGSYHIYLDVYTEGILIAAYQALEDVVIVSVPTPPPPPPGECIIWGFVYDGLIKKPLPDVQITIDGFVWYPTSSQGAYEIRDIACKQYRMEFSKEGYVTVTRYATSHPKPYSEAPPLNISLPPIVPAEPYLVYARPAEAQIASGATGHINYKVGIPNITTGYRLFFLFTLEGVYCWTPYGCANVNFRAGATAGYYEGSASWYVKYMYGHYKFANIPRGTYRLLSWCFLNRDGTLVKTYWKNVDTGQKIIVI